MAKIELFHFATSVHAWRYTSADRSILVGSELYEVSPGLSADAAKLTGSIHKADLAIHVPRDHELVSLFMIDRPEEVVSATLFRANYPNPVPRMWWKGRIVSCNLKGAKATITCESIFTSLARPGLRAMYQLICRHGLYRPGCNVVAENFRLSGHISAHAGTAATIEEAASYPDGHFAAGYMVQQGRYAMIYEHTGNQIVTDRMIMATGPVLIYPGCNHDRSDCHGKFNNILNFGGFSWIPQRSPFNTDISFISGPNGSPNMVY